MDNIFEYHQYKIAKQTMELSDAGARIMGGMTKDEARGILSNRQKQLNAQKGKGFYCPGCDMSIVNRGKKCKKCGVKVK